MSAAAAGTPKLTGFLQKWNGDGQNHHPARARCKQAMVKQTGISSTMRYLQRDGQPEKGTTLESALAKPELLLGKTQGPGTGLRAWSQEVSQGFQERAERRRPSSYPALVGPTNKHAVVQLQGHE